MKTALTKLQQQILVLLVIACLTGLAGLEPVLHNHDLDEDTHEDCFSCGWTQVNLDTTPPLAETFNFSFKTFTPQKLNDRTATSVSSVFSSRAPPTFS